MSITGDHRLLKRLNRMALVRQVRQAPGSSRADLAISTGLTKSTVSLLSQELIDEGWLVELELDPAATRGSGRPPTPLALDEQRLAFVGVDIGLGAATAVATNLVGTVLMENTAPIDSSDPSSACKQVASLISALLQGPELRRRTTIGIGVAVPGAVDDRTGVLRFAPNIGWKELPLRDMLRQALAGGPGGNLPVYVQNDADVGALGEFEFIDRPVDEPLVYLVLGTGIGAGIIVNDRLLTGHGGFAGEIGHTILDARGPRCSCGRNGCTEAFVGLGAIVESILGPGKARHAQDAHALLRSLPPAAFDPARVAKDAALKAALERAGAYVGQLMQNLWAAFDPASIVLGGPSCEFGEALLGPARAELVRYAEAAGLKPPVVRTTRFGRLAQAVGAAAAVIHYQVRPLTETQQGQAAEVA